MGSFEAVWQRVWARLSAPKVSPQRIQQCLDRVREALPAPVFWLLGKAQSGKTSIIRAITGSDRAEIGNGFRACTRTAHLYCFPSESDCFVRFLDTRGLGEVAYDPAEDLHVLEDQSHCLIVVMKAMDHAQRCVVEAARTILQHHPRWPLVVVQTALHEGYPTPQTPHILPYPYADDPWPPSIPNDLARSLAVQRSWFAGWNARFVAVDFTLPEDGYEPEFYGLDALWSAIEEAVPVGLWAMLRQTPDVRRPLRDIYSRTARSHVLWYAIAAGLVASMPVPLIDLPLFVALQGKMFHTVASIYGQPMSPQRMAEILSTLGLGILARWGGRELLKFIPGLGSAVSALFAAASTYALGCTLCAYFSYALDGDVPTPALLRQLYLEQYEEGRRRLRPYLDWAAQYCRPSHDPRSPAP